MIENLSTNKYVQNLALGLLGTATAFGIVGMPQEAQAQSLSYGYSYQEIRDLRLTGLNGVIANPSSFRFQPTANTQAGLNGATAGDINATNPLEAVVGGAGLGQNAGFFDNNAFNSSWRTVGGNPADFSRSDAQLAQLNASGQIQTIANPAELTALLLDPNSQIRLANVAESLVQQPTSAPVVGNPLAGTDDGNARGSYSFGVSNFQVTAATTLGISFDYLNALAIELSGPSPVAGQTSFTQSQFQFAVNVVRTNLDGSNSTTILNYVLAPNNASLSANNQLQNYSSIVRNDIGLPQDLTPPDFVFTQPSPLLNAALAPGFNYSINFNAFEQVDTRIFEQKQVEIPEPTSAVALLGFSSLGLALKKRKKQQA